MTEPVRIDDARRQRQQQSARLAVRVWLILATWTEDHLRAAYDRLVDVESPKA